MTTPSISVELHAATLATAAHFNAFSAVTIGNADETMQVTLYICGPMHVSRADDIVAALVKSLPEPVLTEAYMSGGCVIP